MFNIQPKTSVELHKGKQEKILSLFKRTASQLRESNSEIDADRDEALRLSRQYQDEAMQLGELRDKNDRLASKMEEFVA